MVLSAPDLKELVAEGAVWRPDGAPVSIDCASIGLHLDGELLRYRAISHAVTPPAAVPTERIVLSERQPLLFEPGMRLLGCSLEVIRMPLDVMGFIQTKGSVARGFILVHSCDGQIDPGFHGKATLELMNLSQMTYQLRVAMPIAQLFFFRLSQRLEKGYAGRYQGAEGPTPMRERVKR
jgi:dCTP deaminase